MIWPCLTTDFNFKPKARKNLCVFVLLVHIFSKGSFWGMTLMIDKYPYIYLKIVFFIYTSILLNCWTMAQPSMGNLELC